jgi:hypothetical protein
MRAFLTAFFNDRIEFVVVQPDGKQRQASVLRYDGVSFASTWLSLEFPHILNDGGASLGNEQLDHLLKLQAHAELIRHRAAIEAIRA